MKSEQYYMFIISYEDHSGPPRTHASWNIVYVLNCFKMCVYVCVGGGGAEFGYVSVSMVLSLKS